MFYIYFNINFDLQFAYFETQFFHRQNFTQQKDSTKHKIIQKVKIIKILIIKNTHSEHKKIYILKINEEAIACRGWV